MANASVTPFQEWVDRRTASLDYFSSEIALSHLGLKWESLPEPCHDYRQFLKKSRDGTLLCTASNIVTEIWDVHERLMLERFPSPNTQTSCMDWLSDNSLVTGGHDKTMTLWREGHSQGQLIGHFDWVRSLSVNLTDSVVASGDADSAIGVWDLPRMQNISMTVLSRSPEVELNAVMDLCFNVSSPYLFYPLQRSGHLSMWDVRAARPMQWHIRAHAGHTSAMRMSSDSIRFLTSSRGSEVKLWDTRTLPSPQSLQTYNQHPSEKLALGCDFLRYEQFVVTGSDDEFAYVYETNTGRLVKKIALAPGQVVTACAEEEGSWSFFVVYLNGRYFGLVDSDGSDIFHTYTSSEQIKAHYSKEAWDTAFSRNTDRVLVAARFAQAPVAINYEQMMAIVRDSDLPVCKMLMRDLTAEYEANIKASTPRLVRDLQAFFEKSLHCQSRPTILSQSSMEIDPPHVRISCPTAVMRERATLREKLSLFRPAGD